MEKDSILADLQDGNRQYMTGKRRGMRRAVNPARESAGIMKRNNVTMQQYGQEDKTTRP